MQKVSASEFTKDVNEGLTKAVLIKKYGISEASVKKVAKQLGLTIKRAVKPKFELVFDAETTEVTENTTTGLNA